MVAANSSLRSQEGHIACRSSQLRGLDGVSRHYGLALTQADVASFAPAVAGLLSSWDAVERLYAENAPSAPDRTWTRPADADNPLGAWYVTTSISGKEGGRSPGVRLPSRTTPRWPGCR
jgi:hypothetical protein